MTKDDTPLLSPPLVSFILHGERYTAGVQPGFHAHLERRAPGLPPHPPPPRPTPGFFMNMQNDDRNDFYRLSELWCAESDIPRGAIQLLQGGGTGVV